MRVPLVLPVAFVSCLAAAGCSTTVSLKQPAATAPLAPSAASSAPATQPAAPAFAPAAPAVASQGPAPAIVPPASGMPSPAQSGGAVKRRVTMGDRMSSGMQTGSVGAFFGSFAGPVGFAAGGGTGFLIGFLAGQSPFGPPAPEVRSGSWENEVESQRAWEAQVRDHLAQLDAQAQAQGAAGAPPSQGTAAAASAVAVPPAQGMAQTPSGVPVTAAVATEGGADPMADYEAWSRQITAYAQPAVARTGAKAAPAAKEERTSAREDDPKTPAGPGDGAAAPKAPVEKRGTEDRAVSAVDSNGDGRQDTWFIYEGSALRMQAADISGDGRPDREDLYTNGRVTSRRLDNDADGRFETIETIEDDTIAGWVMDLDGDGRYESRSVKDAEGVHHVERDSDGDGRTDAWIMMIGEGAHAAVREQVDTDRDGKADTTTLYVDGHVVKQDRRDTESLAAKKAGTGS